jgi:hypothetical protein
MEVQEKEALMLRLLADEATAFGLTNVKDLIRLMGSRFGALRIATSPEPSPEIGINPHAECSICTFHLRQMSSFKEHPMAICNSLSPKASNGPAVLVNVTALRIDTIFRSGFTTCTALSDQSPHSPLQNHVK